jgi:hypothetical protein
LLDGEALQFVAFVFLFDFCPLYGGLTWTSAIAVPEGSALALLAPFYSISIAATALLAILGLLVVISRKGLNEMIMVHFYRKLKNDLSCSVPKNWSLRIKLNSPVILPID